MKFINIEKQFSEQEQRIVTAAISLFYRGTMNEVVGFPTLVRWIAEWYRFVQDVEDGYKLIIECYTNSLDVRSLIGDCIEHLPETLGIKVTAIVADADMQYFGATMPYRGQQRWRPRKYEQFARKPKILNHNLRTYFEHLEQPDDRGYTLDGCLHVLAQVASNAQHDWEIALHHATLEVLSEDETVRRDAANRLTTILTSEDTDSIMIPVTLITLMRMLNISETPSKPTILKMLADTLEQLIEKSPESWLLESLSDWILDDWAVYVSFLQSRNREVQLQAGRILFSELPYATAYRAQLRHLLDEFKAQHQHDPYFMEAISRWA